jgi:DNA-binding transcriptional ArsR family regulator
MPSVDTLSSTFAALADPTRRAILARLAEGDASVGEIAAPFAISLPAVSRHLKVLETAQLIVREKDAQWRRCRLDAAPLKVAALRPTERRVSPMRSSLSTVPESVR